MKKIQKGFIAPVLLLVIVLLVIGGSVYVYESKKTESPVVVDTQEQTNTQTPPVTNQEASKPATQSLITISSPSAGTVWLTGNTYQVKWQTSGIPVDTQGYVLIKNMAQGGDYYVVNKSVALNGGASSNYGGSRTWAVPPASASFVVGTYVIRIGIGRYEDYDGAQSTYFDSRSFTISTPPVTTSEQKVLATAREVISALSARDYQKLEGLVSSDGLSLNFYPQLDLVKNLIPKSEISIIPKDTEIYLWGYTDGKGDPINLTRAEFLSKGIYTNSVDYLKAPDVAVNKILGNGNYGNTIDKDVNGRTYVAFHFSGFDPKYAGMDWTTLYLVFDSVNGEYKLRGIAKDNWSI